MKNAILIAVVIMLLSVIPAFSAIPVDPASQAMYAEAFTIGGPVAVNLSPYNPPDHALRLNPANALGPFDAYPGVEGLNTKFFALASQTSSHWTFADRFSNVDWPDTFDIEFAEVTWANWHTEAAKVYLTGAKVNGVPYGAADDGIGYYAGIVWNKVGIEGIDPIERDNIAQSYLPIGVVRNFIANEFYTDGNYGISGFNLPDEVDCAEGITLVDITADVYDENNLPISQFVPGTFTTPGGSLVIATALDPFAFMEMDGIGGNTDGYDLDAIRVYRCAPYMNGDSATGLGNKILSKGTWFMYNRYIDPNVQTAGNNMSFRVQAGNPKNGSNIIGTYVITDLGDGWYVANYNIFPTITKNGWIYDIVVDDEHLGISNTMSFKAKPGQDDNQDFGVPFYDADGSFYIFAHFAVNYE